MWMWKNHAGGHWGAHLPDLTEVNLTFGLFSGMGLTWSSSRSGYAGLSTFVACIGRSQCM